MQRTSTQPLAALLAGAFALLLCIAPFAGTAHAGRPGEPEYVVVKAGKVITVSGEEIDRGEIVMVDGRITLVGIGLNYPESARVIDARNQIVMPGLIHARSQLGVPDFNRRGINGSVAVDKEIIYEDIDFDPLVRNGFTAVVLQPRGGGISGVAAAYAPAVDEAWKRSISRSLYLLIDFTSFPGDKNTLREAITRARAEIQKVEEARKKWDEEQAKKAEEAKKQAEQQKKESEQQGQGGQRPPQGTPPRPQQGGQQGGQPGGPQGGASAEPDKPAEFVPPEINADLKPIVALLQNDPARTRAMIDINSASAVLHLEDALSMLKDGEHFEHFLCITRVAGTDLSLVVDRIASKEVGVLLSPELTNLPQTATRYNLAGDLMIRGVTVGFYPNPDSPFGYERYLNNAAELARSGVPRAEILKALTLNPAKILGLDRRMGSIEVGKNANLIFLNRDPLDPTARIMRVMVRGHIAYEAEN